MLPGYVSAPFRSSGSLVELLPEWLASTHQMNMVYPNRKNPSKAQSAFRAYVEAYDFSRLASALP